MQFLLRSLPRVGPRNDTKGAGFRSKIFLSRFFSSGARRREKLRKGPSAVRTRYFPGRRRRAAAGAVWISWLPFQSVPAVHLPALKPYSFSGSYKERSCCRKEAGKPADPLKFLQKRRRYSQKLFLPVPDKCCQEDSFSAVGTETILPGHSPCRGPYRGIPLFRGSFGRSPAYESMVSPSSPRGRNWRLPSFPASAQSSSRQI